jgi:putative pyruvate formate lyase activating enzyme
VASFDPHFGEESPLVGKNGSGTIFFSGCNLLCRFCQNFDISHQMVGTEWSPEDLAGAMISLQGMGCHNINFVTPSHVVPQILMGLEKAVAGGLHIPLVYNSSGYDKVETLEILNGVFDIYMPDFKFWDSQVAQRWCQASDYPEKARAAIREMHRQVGDLQVNGAGIAERGVLIRHLVLPDGLAGTRDIMRFLRTEISGNSYVNIMAQYRPCGLVSEDVSMSRPLRRHEYEAAIEMAREEGITRLDQRRRKFVIDWF